MQVVVHIRVYKNVAKKHGIGRKKLNFSLIDLRWPLIKKSKFLRAAQGPGASAEAFADGQGYIRRWRRGGCRGDCGRARAFRYREGRRGGCRCAARLGRPA